MSSHEPSVLRIRLARRPPPVRIYPPDRTRAPLRARARARIFIAESAKVIERAVRAGLVPESFLLGERWLDQLLPLLREVSAANPGLDIPVFVAPMDLMETLCGFKVTRGALAAFHRPPMPDPAAFLDALIERGAGRPVRVCVLEGIVDHTNVGAIFRSAAALNVDGILVSPTCCDPLYRRSVRVSMGTVFQVPWCRIGRDAASWPHDGLAVLHGAGFTCAAMALADDSVSLDEPSLKAIDRLALFMGTEDPVSRRRPSPGATGPSASPWPTVSTR